MTKNDQKSVANSAANAEKDYHLILKLGPHLTSTELNDAALVLSESYTKWQQNPKNQNPVKTDTSPPVYARMIRKVKHEAVLYYEAGQLRGVFVHSVSPKYDQYPLRKLSYLGVSPAEPGYKGLLKVFRRYVEFVTQQEEDVLIASDLDQTTLNSLLAESGFREVTDRNETFFLLSQLLQRKLFSFQQVEDDFVIDQIIKLDGKAIRRNKKLYKLQTTGYDFHRLYCHQLDKRIHRSLSPENLCHLHESFTSHGDDGTWFISSFDGTITLEDETKGGFSSLKAMIGPDHKLIMPEIIDRENGMVYLLPEDEDALREIAEKIVLRPGFYDFLFFCLKILGSFCIVSAATPYQVRFTMERRLSDSIPLRYIDLVERIITADLKIMPGQTKTFSDGLRRTAYSFFDRTYADLRPDSIHLVKKKKMIKNLLASRGNNKAPIIYLGNNMGDAEPVMQLSKEAAKRKVPVLVFDLGTELTPWVTEALAEYEQNNFFSIICIRDFYQIPVVLESMGLEVNRTWSLG